MIGSSACKCASSYTVFKKGSQSFIKNISPSLHKDYLVSVFGVNLTKDEIWKCPIKRFEGNIHVIATERDLERGRTRKAIKRVFSSSVVGFDTETAVTFPRRTCLPHQIGLVQIATDNDVILWRLRRKKQYSWKRFPPVLKDILKNNKIIKVGNGTYDDLKHLYETYDVTVSNMVDNQTIAQDIGYNKIGLVPLAAQLFGWRISKAEQLSNWEVPELSDSQMQYAATDAWVSLMIYRELSNMADALKLGKPRKGTTSFQHILRQEAKIDSDFLHSLDFFSGNMHTKRSFQNESTKRRQKPRLSFDASHYDLSELAQSLKKFSDSTSNKITIKSNSKQFPFVYQVQDSYAVT